MPSERRLRVTEIAANPWQPRVEFDDTKLQELAASIRADGVIQPLLVRPRNGGFELMAGERRLRAAKLAGLETVPVVVQQKSDRQALELALVENLQREDLSPLEEATAYQRLAEEFDLSQEEIAGRVGRSRPAVANTLRLLSLPEAVQDDLRAGKLSAGHARALLALESADEQIALARETIRRALSVRQLEQRIRTELEGSPPTVEDPPKDLHVVDVEKQLMRSLGTRVRLVSRGGRRGRIVIEFYSPDELERLIVRLR